LAPGRRSAYEVLQVRDEAEQVVVQAAYRALAALHHPDLSSSPMAERRMAELNDAYASVRSPERRQVYDRLRRPIDSATAKAASAPIVTPAPGRSTVRPDTGAVLDFGRYAGWTLADLFRHDPDYLRWLSRHSSGIRYRRSIELLLRDPVKPSAAERMRTTR
jgi:curved DNA-binding protein CbpA